MTRVAVPTDAYPNIREEIQRNFGVVLTSKQVKRFSKGSLLKRALVDDVCDTMERDYLIDNVVHAVLGEGWRFPLNMDTPEYTELFVVEFSKACKRDGIALSKEYWGEYA